MRMLPEFPNARRRMEQIWLAALDAGMRRDALLAQIPVRMQKEGHSASLGDSEMEYKPISATTSIPTLVGEGLSVADFFDKAEEMGVRMAEQQVKDLFVKMSEPSPFSQSFSFGPESTFDDVLSLWDKMEVRFDAAGRPIWPSIIGDPQYQGHLREMLQTAAEDPASRRKWAALVEKKRREYDEREARRRLVE